MRPLISAARPTLPRAWDPREADDHFSKLYSGSTPAEYIAALRRAFQAARQALTTPYHQTCKTCCTKSWSADTGWATRRRKRLGSTAPAAGRQGNTTWRASNTRTRTAPQQQQCNTVGMGNQQVEQRNDTAARLQLHETAAASAQRNTGRRSERRSVEHAARHSDMDAAHSGKART